MYDYLIIGKGLMGAAAFRYLSGVGQTAVLGPDEPTDPARFQGPFGAHYDAGRLAHFLTESDLWLAIGARALAAFPELEEASGRAIFTPSGGVRALHPERDRAYLQTFREMGHKHEVAFEILTNEEGRQRFPYLHFPDDYCLVWDKAPAGHFNPRALLAAQLQLGQAAGGEVIRETAVRLSEQPTHLQVESEQGNRYQARRVLLATGAFTNFFNLTPQPLKLNLKSEYFIRAELEAAEAARLQETPTVNYQIDSPDIREIYLVPPVRYPDGRYYLKMGANTRLDRYLTTRAELTAWYQSGDSDRLAAPLQAALRQIYPGLKALDWQTGRCVITYTAHGQPYIDRLLPGKVYTIIGGNGRGAYPSDLFGHLAAELAIHDRWSDPLPAEAFRLHL